MEIRRGEGEIGSGECRRFEVERSRLVGNVSPERGSLLPGGDNVPEVWGNVPEAWGTFQKTGRTFQKLGETFPFLGGRFPFPGEHSPS